MKENKWIDELGPAMPSRRPTIDELEAIIAREEDEAIEILPNGEIRRAGQSTTAKPLTLRENLGGEYAIPHPTGRSAK